MDTPEVKDMVRERYGSIAAGTSSSCCEPTCCTTAADHDRQSAQMGYSADELAAVPAGANLGLGCGNPQAIAAIKPGETVLDLGSGAGFDCFLAAKQVGPTGYDTRDAEESSGECREDRRPQRGVPPRRNRTPADR
jgi:hypothetical protein